MNEYLPYAAVIIAVVGFCIQFGMFVRPVDLETKLASEREKNDAKYMNKDLCKSKHEPIEDMKAKIDKIYDHLIKEK